MVKELYFDVERILEKELVIGEELIEVNIFTMHIVSDRLGKIMEASTI